MRSKGSRFVTDVKFRDMVARSSEEQASLVARDETWSRVRSLGQRMLDAGRTGDWVSASAILSERNALIRRFFAEPVTVEDAPAVAASIREAIDEHDELRRLSEAGREEVQDKLRSLRAGKKARQAYLSAP